MSECSLFNGYNKPKRLHELTVLQAFTNVQTERKRQRFIGSYCVHIQLIIPGRPLG